MSAPTLRVPATTIDQLTTELLQDDQLERIALLECSETGADLVVSDCDVVADEEMQVITETKCRMDPDSENAFVDQCVSHGRHPLFVHSHPFAAAAWFSTGESTVNDESVMTGSTWIHHLHDCRVLFGVLSQDELRVDEVHPDASRTCVETEIVGTWTLDEASTVDPVTPDDTEHRSREIDTDLYDRPIRAIGEAGQRQLTETHVAVVGCGGIGSHLVQQLAGLGVTRVTFIDPDRVERSNLPRLPQATEQDVDRYKVAVMQQWYATQVPNAETTIISLPVQETEDYLTDLGVDVVLAGLDRITPRVWVNEYAAKHLIPYIDAGSIVDTDEDGQLTVLDAQVQVILPGTDTGCFECVGRINSEATRREGLPRPVLEEEVNRGYIPDTALTPEPAVNPLNTVIAAEAIDQLVRLVTGYRDPVDTVRYDGMTKQLTTGVTHESGECYTCSRFTGTGDTGPVADDDDLALDEALAALPDPTESVETAPQQYQIPDAVTMFFTNHL